MSENIKGVRSEVVGSHLKLVLMYPALVIAIIGAIPTYAKQVSALVDGVSVAEKNHNDRQQGLLEKNLDCIKERFPSSVMTEEKVRLDATVCPSGDVWIVTISPSGQTVSTWVPMKGGDA